MSGAHNNRRPASNKWHMRHDDDYFKDDDQDIDDNDNYLCSDNNNQSDDNCDDLYYLCPNVYYHYVPGECVCVNVCVWLYVCILIRQSNSISRQ